ncbi:merozoite surface protein 3 [Plasmodium malariae]|uniref:Merozoite surface protein 3 n=1 Tax=Plasmodium malariae TaxID=5858 RepID=A0A1A8VVW8_PLAMA|nr:merozoite surface protein 3 [Plasmodium malariae]
MKFIKKKIQLKFPSRSTIAGTTRGTTRGTVRSKIRGTIRRTIRGTIRRTIRGTIRRTIRGTIRRTKSSALPDGQLETQLSRDESNSEERASGIVHNPGSSKEKEEEKEEEEDKEEQQRADQGEVQESGTDSEEKGKEEEEDKEEEEEKEEEKDKSSPQVTPVHQDQAGGTVSTGLSEEEISKRDKPESDEEGSTEVDGRSKPVENSEVESRNDDTEGSMLTERDVSAGEGISADGPNPKEPVTGELGTESSDLTPDNSPTRDTPPSVSEDNPDDSETTLQDGQQDQDNKAPKVEEVPPSELPPSAPEKVEQLQEENDSQLQPQQHSQPHGETQPTHREGLPESESDEQLENEERSLPGSPPEKLEDPSADVASSLSQEQAKNLPQSDSTVHVETVIHKGDESVKREKQHEDEDSSTGDVTDEESAAGRRVEAEQQRADQGEVQESGTDSEEKGKEEDEDKQQVKEVEEDKEDKQNILDPVNLPEGTTHNTVDENEKVVEEKEDQQKEEEKEDQQKEEEKVEIKEEDVKNIVQEILQEGETEEAEEAEETSEDLSEENSQINEAEDKNKESEKENGKEASNVPPNDITAYKELSMEYEHINEAKKFSDDLIKSLVTSIGGDTSTVNVLKDLEKDMRQFFLQI